MYGCMYGGRRLQRVRKTLNLQQPTPTHNATPMLPSFLTHTLFPRIPPQTQPNPPKFLSSQDLESYPPPGSLTTIQGPICDQLQSPLFGKIPPEIRNEIFRLVLCEYVPLERKWGEERRGETVNFVRRPGCEGVGRVRTEVVGVCWRVSC